MCNRKIIAAVIMLFMVVVPTLAEHDKDGKDNEKYEEIDNYDFLYANEDYDEYNFATVDNVLDEAFSHLGARYRSGHSGPKAFDCSGFTSYVFKNMGIDLNRSSRAQYTQGDPVSKANLQSGDLVFFNGSRIGSRIGHVGIVVDVDPISGSFNFIHASRNGVKVSSSNEVYYSRRYVGARRVM